jgi:uncharacterized protein (TIGR03663 family)
MDLKAKIKHEWPAIGILLVAAAVRLTLLSIKPPHFDEGVNGWFVDQMMRTGFYHYDPTNYHGPFHFYVLFLAQVLLGRHIWALRLPLVLISLATVWLTMRFDRFIGREAALWAAAAMAVSPGGVFYARYAIHEGWLVFSLMLCAWGLAGLWQSGERGYFWAVIIGVTGAVLTKETYVIHFGCLALALPVAWLVGVVSPAAEREKGARQQWTGLDMTLGVFLFVAVVLFFYSGTFMDMRGLKGLYQTFGAWFQTGKTGNGHEKSWYYWLKLFGMYEWPSCIGLLVAILSVLPRVPRFIRVLAIYGCGALAAYSVIHYKTPWCVISLTWPFLLLFGCGVAFAVRKSGKFGPLVAVLSAVLLAANLCDSVALNFYHFTDAKQPYVYVQTFEDVNKLMNPLNVLVARSASNYQMTGHIVMESYHPLPWLLGDFPNVGYYEDDATPPSMDADFLLVEDTRIDDVENGLHDQYFTEGLTLRDAEDESRLYLNVKKFRSVFPGRTPDFVPSKEAPKVPAEKKPTSSPMPAEQPSQ